MQNKNPELSLDLSNYSSPISTLFEQPRNAAEWEQFVLTQDQIEFFRDNGYLSGIKILNHKQVDALNEELVRLQHGNKEDRKLFYHYESNESEDPNKVLFHAIVINAMGHDTMRNTAGYERLDALSSFPDMPQDRLLTSRFFPLLIDDRDPAMKALTDNIPTIKTKTY